MPCLLLLSFFVIIFIVITSIFAITLILQIILMWYLVCGATALNIACLRVQIYLELYIKNELFGGHPPSNLCPLQDVFGRFHINMYTFSICAIIWVNHKVLSKLSQTHFVTFSHWNSLKQNSVFEFFCGWNKLFL